MVLLFFSSFIQEKNKDNFYLTAVNNDSVYSADVVLAIFGIQCKYFLEENNNGSYWSTDGCVVVNSTENWTTCKCSHLTMFGVSNIPLSVDYSIVFLQVR